MCSISSDHQVKVDFYLLRSARGGFNILNFNPSSASPEVGSCQLMIEEQLYVLKLAEGIEQLAVQLKSVNRINGLSLVSGKD